MARWLVLRAYQTVRYRIIFQKKIHFLHNLLQNSFQNFFKLSFLYISFIFHNFKKLKSKVRSWGDSSNDSWMSWHEHKFFLIWYISLFSTKYGLFSSYTYCIGEKLVKYFAQKTIVLLCKSIKLINITFFDKIWTLFIIYILKKRKIGQIFCTKNYCFALQV